MPRPRRTQEEKTTLLVKQVAIYARVSSKEQAEEGYSLDAQLGLLRGYALAKGFVIAAEFVESETAKEAGRKKFGQMVALIESGSVQAIICEKTDRLYRNLKDRCTIGELDVELHCVKEGAILSKSSKSHEKFIHDIKLVVAKNYIDNLSEEASKGLWEKAKQGIWPSTAPLGYLNTLDGHRRVIDLDPERAEIVADLFTKFAAGTHSLKTLTVYARENGLRSKKGFPLTKGVIYWILTNPIYRGVVKWKEVEYPGIHKPLIDAATWWKVHATLTGRTSQTSFGSREYLYRGLFSCAKCGCAFTGYTAKGKYVYYACNGSRGCSRAGIREEAIDAAVMKSLHGLTIRPQVLELLTQALRESYEEVDKARAPQIEALDRERVKLRARISRAYEDKLDGEIDLATYRQQTAKWNKELSEVESALARFERADREYFDENVAMLEVAANSYRTFEIASKDERRELLRYLLSNSQIVAGKPALNFKSWFNLILKVNEDLDQNGGLDTDLQKWHGVLDALRTRMAA